MRWVILTNFFFANLLLAAVTNCEVVTNPELQFIQLGEAAYDSSMSTPEEKKDPHETLSFLLENENQETRNVAENNGGTGAYVSSENRGLSLQNTTETPIMGDYYMFVVSGGLKLNGRGYCNLISMNGNLRVFGAGKINITSNGGTFYTSSDGYVEIESPGFSNWRTTPTIKSVTLITSNLESYYSDTDTASYFSITAKDTVNTLLVIEGEYSVSGSGGFSGYGTGAFMGSFYWTGLTDITKMDSNASDLFPLGETFLIDGDFPNGHLDWRGLSIACFALGTISVEGNYVHMRISGNGSFSSIGYGEYFFEIDGEEESEDTVEPSIHSFSHVGKVFYTEFNSPWVSVTLSDPTEETSMSISTEAHELFHASVDNTNRCWGHGTSFTSYFVTG